MYSYHLLMIYVVIDFSDRIINIYNEGLVNFARGLELTELLAPFTGGVLC